jgi:DNA-binding GntR family transcriptional regulator
MDLDSLAFKPAVRQTLSENVTDSLRLAIFQRELKPGFPLPEAKIAERLGVSRAPIREALSVLAQEGLVERGDRGMFVATLKQADIDEISSLRLTLESLAVRLVFARRPSVDFAPLEQVIDQTRRARGVGRAGELDLEFHELFVRAAQHQRLHSAWLALRSQIRLLLFQMDQDDREFARHTAEAHAAFLGLVQTGTEAAALQLLERHLENTHQQVVHDCGG